MSETFVAVAREDQLHEGQQMLVRVDGKAIILCKSDAQIFAIENRCTHDNEQLLGGAMKKITREDALEYHRRAPHGKIEVVPTKPTATQVDLSLAAEGAPTTGTRTVSSLSAGSGEKFAEKARIGSSAPSGECER